MKRKFRLTSSTDFQRVRRLGKSYAHPLIVLIALERDRQIEASFERMDDGLPENSEGSVEESAEESRAGLNIGLSAEINSRVGITAGRSVGNAVKRNRAKRLMRAAVQTYISNLKPNQDVVIIARRPIVDASLDQVKSALSQLLQRSDLLIGEDEG